MEIKKKDLIEVIDSNGDLIGLDDIPKFNANADTIAHSTTDQNAKTGQQPFRYDMLGRFGFTLMPFMEGVEENDGQAALVKDLAKLMYDKYMSTIEHYYRNPNKLKSDFRMHSEHDFESQPEHNMKIDYDLAKDIIKVVQKHFEDAFKEPEQIDESFEGAPKNTITFKSTKNEKFYITFNFNDNGKLISVDNRWDIIVPNWWGLKVPLDMMVDYFKYKYPELYLVDVKKNNSEMLNSTIPFDEKIREKLAGLLGQSKYAKTGILDQRIDQLLKIHGVWLEKAKQHYSAEEIAQKLAKYDENLMESKVVEDKVIGSKSEEEITKRGESKDVRVKKIEKIAGLINKLEKKDIDKLINLLERK